MTGWDVFRRAGSDLATLGFDTSRLLPETVYITLRTVMDDLNTKAPCYWRRQWMPTIAGIRFYIAPAELISVLAAAIDGQELRCVRSLEFAGPGHTAAQDGTGGMPGSIWTTRDEHRGLTLIGLDRRPTTVHYIHGHWHYQVPVYQGFDFELPVHPGAHNAVMHGVLARIYKGKDFHHKSFQAQHAAEYERETRRVQALSRVTSIAPANTTDGTFRQPVNESTW